MPKEHLKLDSRLSVVGAFWKPESPDTIMTGTLVSDENAIEFTTAPFYERNPTPSPGMLSGPDQAMIPSLHGFTEAGNSTLCQLVEGRGPNSTSFALGQAITSRAFRVLTLIEGMHIGGIHDKCLTSAKFSFSGLSEFFPPAFTEEWTADKIVVHHSPRTTGDSRLQRLRFPSPHHGSGRPRADQRGDRSLSSQQVRGLN
jgi:hypothetical protein